MSQKIVSSHRIFGLVGYPLGHSFSRQYFTQKFADENIDAEYLNFELPQISELPALLDSLPALVGFNVTIPYKEQVIAYLDGLDDVARKIGAVNVVKVDCKDDGGCRLTGYNTDVVGFRDSIAPHLKPWNRKALVLGSGGASKAVVAGLEMLGVGPTIVSRSQSEAERLTYSDLTPEVMEDHTVIVNTTPLGMFPKIDACPPIPYELISDRHLCFDLVYNPAVTLFMKRCAERDATTIGGLEMLHLQAEAAWKIWNNAALD